MNRGSAVSGLPFAGISRYYRCVVSRDIKNLKIAIFQYTDLVINVGIYMIKCQYPRIKYYLIYMVYY